jgi:hypothetical protein
VAIISFYEEPLKRVKKTSPTIPVGIVYMQPPGKMLDAKREGYEMVLPRYGLATTKSIGLSIILKNSEATVFHICGGASIDKALLQIPGWLLVKIYIHLDHLKPLPSRCPIYIHRGFRDILALYITLGICLAPLDLSIFISSYITMGESVLMG